MFEKIKEITGSRQFQTGAGQIAIAVVSIVVSTVVSKTVNGGLNAGLEALMDKIHGPAETPQA